MATVGVKGLSELRVVSVLVYSAAPVSCTLVVDKKPICIPNKKRCMEIQESQESQELQELQELRQNCVK